MPHANHAAEQAFGTLGTICWTVQLIPQVWKSYREKDTHGLSHWLVLLWGISGALQGIYVILQRLNIPLMIQPQLFGFLSLMSWGQCQYYGFKRSRKVAILMTVSTMLLCGIFELILILTLRPSHDRGQHAPAAFFGILSSVTISVALLPQYWEIYKCCEVIGISVLFIFVDMMGGVFNDLSLAFREDFDIIAAVTYTLVVVLDGMVLIAALILNPRARKRRRLEAEQNTEDVTQIVETSLSLTRLREDDSIAHLSTPGLPGRRLQEQQSTPDVMESARTSTSLTRSPKDPSVAYLSTLGRSASIASISRTPSMTSRVHSVHPPET